MNYTEHLEGQSVFTLTDVLSPDECAELIASTEAIGFAFAPITTAMGFVDMPEVRNNTRVMVDDHVLADRLWHRVKDFVPADLGGWRAVGLNERLRTYRYESGQYFRSHYDGYYARNRSERSFLTMMIYLNEDFAGGQTAFDGAFIRPQTGSALFFLHQLRHEGCEVTRGRKYAIRTDVMYRRS